MHKIEISAGASLNEAYRELQEYAPSCCTFNGITLTSNDNLDDIYLKVTGKTRTDYENAVRQQNEEYKKEKKEFEDKIPELIEEYKKKARGIIPEDRLELWDNIVPIRLNDIYRGMELDCWLDLILILNDTNLSYHVKMVKANDLFDKQGHSGMSAGLVMSGLKQFHPLGGDLVTYINKVHEL